MNPNFDMLVMHTVKLATDRRWASAASTAICSLQQLPQKCFWLNLVCLNSECFHHCKTLLANRCSISLRRKSPALKWSIRYRIVVEVHSGEVVFHRRSSLDDHLCWMLRRSPKCANQPSAFVERPFRSPTISLNIQRVIQNWHLILFDEIIRRSCLPVRLLASLVE